ncbi:Uncharacterized protein APZ42_002297, partial [Daphnia magna]
LAGPLAGHRPADVVRPAAAGAFEQAPAVVHVLGHVNQPAAGEPTPVLVVVVGVEPVLTGVERQIAVRVAVADRERLQLRAVGLAAEHCPGSQHRRPAAVRPLGEVVVVPAGDVQPAVRSDGEPRHLMVVESAEPLGDGLFDVPFAVRLALLVPPHAAAAGGVQPAV